MTIQVIRRLHPKTGGLPEPTEVIWETPAELNFRSKDQNIGLAKHWISQNCPETDGYEHDHWGAYRKIPGYLEEITTQKKL